MTNPLQCFEIDGDKWFFSGSTHVPYPTPSQLLHFLFQVSELENLFFEKFIDTRTKGIDRLTGAQIATRAKETFQTIERKCLSGTFSFSQYAEVLQLKGRNKAPRVISIPTIRDRLVLHQLKDLLAITFPECVPKARANTVIHAISRDLRQFEDDGKTANVWVYGCDIQKFYDEIDREILLEILSRKIKSEKVLRLIESAINTPTVPRNYKKQDINLYMRAKGIPQGLSISNILASIYMADFDTLMKAKPFRYFRYVDDLIFYGEETVIRASESLVRENLAKLHLETHPIEEHGKSHLSNLTATFGYLGYLFTMPTITVRPATVERFLQSIVGRFSDYSYNKERRKSEAKYLTDERLREIFLSELNERITGAISEKRRYGWISYFSEITDLPLLKRLDHIIAKFFARLDDFENKAPEPLKSLVRAYYEMRYSPTAGYIHNYDKIQTQTQKLQFLVERGKLDPNSTYSEEEISVAFDRYRKWSLADLEPDDGMLY